MNILVVSATSIFPHHKDSIRGIWFGNFFRHLGSLVNKIVVVVPAAYVPAPLLRLPAFAEQRAEPHHWYHGIEVFRPQYLSFRATRNVWCQARASVLGALPLCESLNRRHRFDVVVGLGFGPPSHTAQYVAKAIGKKCANWAIGSDVHTCPDLSAENLRLFSHNVRYSDLVLAASEDLRRMIVRRCPWARHTHVLYWGTDLAGITGTVPDQRGLRAELGLEKDRTYMLSVGHVAKTKGTGEFYEAFRRLAGARPELAAVWVGDGSELANLRNRAREDGLADRFILPGRVPRPRALQFMQAADIMVFPTYKEGLPNVVMEAMASALPVVTTPAGGIPEIIVDGHTGLLVPIRDVQALVEGVQRILGNPHQARKMAHRGRKLILDHFDVVKNVKVGLEIFEHLASGGSRTEPLRACAGVRPGCLPIEMVRSEGQSGD